MIASKETYEVSSPLRVLVTNTKYLTINWNTLKSAHYRTYAKGKRDYTKLMRHIVEDLPVFNKVSICLTLYPKTHRLTDLDNVCGAVCKWFLDALEHWGKIENDNYKYVQHIEFKFGMVDPENPRVDIVITPIKGEEEEGVILSLERKKKRKKKVKYDKPRCSS